MIAVAAGGDGIARLDDGRVVFCEGALPGELVDIVVTSERRDFARARVSAVAEPSAARTVPPCPHVAAGCGGCTWQHVADDADLELKTSIAKDALRRIAHGDETVVRSSPRARGRVPLRGYRTTARLAVDGEGRAAYRRRHSNDPITVSSCLVAHPALEDLIVEARFPGASEVVLRVSAATGEQLVWPDRSASRAVVPAGTAVSRGDPPAALTETVGGRDWRISASSFFQPGPQSASILADAVRAAAGDGLRGAKVVDLYAGVGLLGGSLVADMAQGSLIAVESNGAAAADAKYNLADLDARVIVGEVAGVPPEGVDIVIADPSRSGLGPSASSAVARWDAATVVLVSCDPASMARDVALLDRLGYRLEGIEVLDLFPGTFHVETVSRFAKG